MGTFVENVNLVATGIQQVYDNFDEILLADDNAAICTAMAEVCTSTYDQFDDRYLGPKATTPTTDNDGEALLIGAMYFDTMLNLMNVYSGSEWISITSPIPKATFIKGRNLTDRVIPQGYAVRTAFDNVDFESDEVSISVSYLEYGYDGYEHVIGIATTDIQVGEVGLIQTYGVSDIVYDFSAWLELIYMNTDIYVDDNFSSPANKNLSVLALFGGESGTRYDMSKMKIGRVVSIGLIDDELDENYGEYDFSQVRLLIDPQYELGEIEKQDLLRRSDAVVDYGGMYNYTEMQLRRGSAIDNGWLTGREGELTVDLGNNTLILHDGATQGGIRLAKESDVQTALDTKVDEYIINTDNIPNLFVGNSNKLWTKGIVGFTGMIAIELTGLYSQSSMNGMMNVHILEVSTTKSARIINISGQWNNGTSMWDYGFAVDLNSNVQMNVRFARDAINEKVYILLGETTSTWNNTRVSIEVPLSSYNSGLNLGFNISTLASTSGIAVDILKAIELKADSVVITDALALKADLVDGKVPQEQLPSYVDDVLEFANLAGFPPTGESGKIYIAINTNRSYRWSGSVYVDITGMVDSVAGKTGAVTLVKGDVGLGNVDNTSDTNKPVSTAQQTALNSKQPLDATLTAFAGVTTVADKLVYATGVDTFATTTLTAAARTLLDDADVATMRGTLGISATNTPSTAVGGIVATNVQAAIEELDTEKVAKSVVVTTAITSVTFNADGSLTIVTP